MDIQSYIKKANDPASENTGKKTAFLRETLDKKGISVESVLKELASLKVAIPSWALGTGGTRFGRFPGGGEPSDLIQKLEDVALLHQLSGGCNAISLHIPWDIPANPGALKQYASELGIQFDAVNSNTFQDQPGQPYSYKFGSLCHTDKKVRQQAVDHCIEVIKHGETIGSKSLTVWLADGSSFPGQMHFRNALQNTLESLQEVYNHLPSDWKMLIEYKPYEPNFYSMVIPDWGTSYWLASRLGNKAVSLVDLGHHLPNCNIEQIVARLGMLGKLGGFHFNGSVYGDDDLTTGSTKPYQLYLIFLELVMLNKEKGLALPDLMIDASHNLKDPLEDLLQSMDGIFTAYTKALVTDIKSLSKAQENNDVTLCQEILQDAFQTDVRPLIETFRMENGHATKPVTVFRESGVREHRIKTRGSTKATGL